MPSSDDQLIELLHETAMAIRAALDGLDDWGPSGSRAGQYLSDLAADAIAVEILEEGGVGVLSEESGGHALDRDVVVVVDPLDGSTNASRGIPWFATSLCAVDAAGPRAALVVNQATGETFDACRGAGARRDGLTIRTSAVTDVGEAVVALNGAPTEHWGWAQYRTLGAAALDLCSVACG